MLCPTAPKHASITPAAPETTPAALRDPPETQPISRRSGRREGRSGVCAANQRARLALRDSKTKEIPSAKPLWVSGDKYSPAFLPCCSSLCSSLSLLLPYLCSGLLLPSVLFLSSSSSRSSSILSLLSLLSIQFYNNSSVSIMKFSIVALSGLAAIAASQTATGAAGTATATMSPEASCAAKCAEADVCCRAQCYHVPCPNASMANDTTACVAACPQGNGSPQDTEKYASCEQSCYNSDFFPATGFPAAATGTVASASASATETGKPLASATGSSGSTKTVSAAGKEASGTEASGTHTGSQTGSATASGSAASASNTGAASQLGVQVGSAGIVGAIVAAMVI